VWSRNIKNGCSIYIYIYIYIYDISRLRVNTLFTVPQSSIFPSRTFDYSSLSLLLKLWLCEWFSDPRKQERSRTSTEHKLLSTQMPQHTLFSLACLLAPCLRLAVCSDRGHSTECWIDIAASGKLREHVIQDWSIVENSVGVDEGKLTELHCDWEEHWYSVVLSHNVTTVCYRHV